MPRAETAAVAVIGLTVGYAIFSFGGIESLPTGLLAVGGGVATLLTAVRMRIPKSLPGTPSTPSTLGTPHIPGTPAPQGLTGPSKAVTVLGLGLLGFILLQYLPLPPGLGRLLAGEGRALYDAAGVGAEGEWVPISQRPFATRLVLLRFLTVMGVFLTVAAWASTPRRRVAGVVILLGGIGSVAAVGVVQYLTGAQGPFHPFPTGDVRRLTGPFVNPNHFAGLLELVLPLTLVLLVLRFPPEGRGVRSWVRGVLRNTDKLAGTVAIGVVALLLAVALFLTGSRLGALSFLGIAGIVAIGLGGWGRGGGGRMDRRPRRAFVSIVLVAAVVGGAVGMGFEPIAERTRDLPTDASPPLRLAGWRMTFAMVRDHPLTGTGAGTYGDVVSRYQGRFMATQRRFNTAHNEYLNVLSDGGVVGFLLALALVGSIGIVLARGYRGADRSGRSIILGVAAGLGAVLFHSVGDFPLQIPANAVVAAGLLGLSWAATGAPMPGAPFGRFAPWVVGLAGAVALAGGVELVVSERWDRPLVFADRDDILSRQGWERAREGEAEPAQLREALGLLDSAIRVNPGSSNLAYRRGQIAIALENRALGEAEYERALRLKPRFTPLIFEVALYYGLRAWWERDPVSDRREQELVDELLELDPRRLATLQQRWIEIGRE